VYNIEMRSGKKYLGNGNVSGTKDKENGFQ
jgi:hypothetical protein